MALVDRKDRLGVRRVTELHTGIGAGTKTAEPARAATVLFTCLDERYEELGRYLFAYY